ncbi:interferon-induced, double-stranded RNA-activated protein kinase-like isoform X2 [Sphaeramia orbicularis]|uniref:interferon-induced, double-stranded RNA-activated protein kinase-like isoform X2 n=1 Tax=Sphaeramia orbicularis TaxID=375764 RepID=UPI001180A397|nr:interferon-induced, double-stranded RNA-activated protein kinase-like isoform X2 [Sphaeramia orbicularis]
MMDTVNYMAKLNEFAQKKRVELRFEDVGSAGPDHSKTFTVRAVLNGKVYPDGVGKNKKEARQNAAKLALECFTEEPTEPTEPSVDPSPPLVQTNFVCWLNELGQKRRVSIRPVESIRMGPVNATQCCSFVVGDKEYPTATGKTKKEAKEEAAKLVYQEICGNKTTETSDGDGSDGVESNQHKDETRQTFPDVCEKTQSSSATTEDEGFTDTNYVGIVNHYCQKTKRTPDYVLEKKLGPAHTPRFFYKLVINNKDYPVAEGKNIKEAKQKAAALAWAELQEQSDWDSKVSLHSGVSDDHDASARVSTPPPPSNNKDGKNPPSSDSVVFSDSLNFKNQAQSPDVKPRIRIAANFGNVCKSKEDVMPNLSEKKDRPEKPSSPSASSRFVIDYDCIECLGKGAFGQVFKARHKLANMDCAVKIVRCKEKSLREVGALSKLRHQNIVCYYHCWMEDTQYQWDVSGDSGSTSQSTGSPSVKFLYIQMELCDSKTLRVWIDERNTQNVKKALRDSRRRDEGLGVAGQMVSGVEYVHAHKLIHRDLKPANIMFGRDGEVKIGDFGLVTVENDDDAENLIERTVYKGTPSYMAPEQKNKKTTYDRKVDIFALGLIFFELLWNMQTGHERQAVSLRSSSTVALFCICYLSAVLLLFHFQLWDDARDQKLPQKFLQNFPHESRIIKSMLSAKPQDRPEASKLKTDLEEFSSSLTSTKNTHSV